MTTKAIEAGARAIYENWANYPACDESKPWDFICEKRWVQADDFRRKAKACIEAAIASGELVPASAVAAERERCAKVAENFDHKSVWSGCSSEHELSSVTHVIAGETCDDIAASIRALEPASGEYVLVPREPTKEMVNAGCDARVDGWEDSYYDDEERQEIVEWVKEGYRAMLTAATSNGSGK